MPSINSNSSASGTPSRERRKIYAAVTCKNAAQRCRRAILQGINRDFLEHRVEYNIKEIKDYVKFELHKGRLYKDLKECC